MPALLLFLALMNPRRPADSLSWPLSIEPIITGGFADTRPDHFHGGVDIHTGPENLPVLAPSDGWIERLAVQPPGYGRSLYYRLSDGRTAVFAHLSRFEPALEQMLRDSQLAVGTYRVDFGFEIPTPARAFRRGDTLAFTGKSGIGPPHLHFEIRDGAVQTDPLANYEPRDEQPPVITGIGWTNRSSFSPMSAGFRLPLAKNGTHYRGTAPVHSDEPMAFFIQVHDPGPWGRNSPPAILRVRIDTTVVYEVAPARIDLLGPRDIYERIVMAGGSRRGQESRRLFEVPPPPPNSAALTMSRGWLSNLAGETVRIEAMDRAGNRAEAEIEVSCGPVPDLGSDPVPKTFAAGAFSLTTNSDDLGAWAELNSISPRGVRIGPGGFAFGDRLKLTYQLGANESPDGLYFYQVTSRGARKPLWKFAEDSTRAISCRILRAGSYGVGVDREGPRISVTTRGGRLRFRVTDNASGVDDSTIRGTVDGETSIAEFEYEEHGGVIWTRRSLRSGRHEVRLSAGDRAGNVSKWSGTVRIP